MKTFEIITGSNYTIVADPKELREKGVDPFKITNEDDTAKLQEIVIDTSDKIRDLYENSEKGMSFSMMVSQNGKVVLAVGFREDLYPETLNKERNKLEKIYEKLDKPVDQMLVEAHLMFIDAVLKSDAVNNPADSSAFESDDYYDDEDEMTVCNSGIFTTKDPKLNKIMFLVNNMKSFGLIGRKAKLYKKDQTFYVDVTGMSEEDRIKTEFLLGEADFSQTDKISKAFMEEHCQKWAAL